MYIDWESFNEEVNGKIKYWRDIWSELASNIERGVLGSSIITPHILVSDIQNEIIFNQLKNKENKQYFIEKIKIISSKDKVIKNNYLSEFSLLLDYLEKGNLSYLKVITKNIKEAFSKENYVEYVFSELEKLLLSKKENEEIYEEIKDLSLTLIAELITSGNSLKEIKDMVDQTFSSYVVIKNAIIPLFVNFDLKREDYTNNNDFLDELKKYIDELTIEERIHSFKKYLTKKPQERNYIFPVKGFSRMRNSAIINGIEFYNPLYVSKTNMNVSDPNRAEMFDRGNEGGRVVNLLVKIKSVDIIIGMQKAIEEIEACLDSLRFLYQSDNKIILNKHQCIVTDTQSKIIHQTIGIDENKRKDIINQQSPLDINYIIDDKDNILRVKNVENIFKLSNTNILKRAIMNALSWYEKAKSTDKVEEKLLNYWISIENLMEFKDSNTHNNVFYKEDESKYQLAKKLISENTALYYLDNLLGDLYIEILSNRHSSRMIFQNLSKEIYEECNFGDSAGYISLVPFLDNLPQLVQHTDRKILIDKLNFVYDFYKNNQTAYKVIRQKVKEVENDILYIYKYRNQIVHNGHVDQNILPHIVQNAKKYATYLISEVIHQSAETDKELIDIMVNIDYRYNILIKNLGDKNKQINLLTVKL
ncbi:hypothetical protein ABE236_00050 [Priestia endophytica]|uniref:hypothetical protein n=1 Tax=Priestia endophytica TaxID=135735 RepID=UPI003D26F43E